MSKMTDIQKKVDEAMNSLLNIHRAEPTPFFYTRLEARMAKGESNVWDRLSLMITRPAIAFITISAVLIMNLFVAFNDTPLPGLKPDLSEVATADDLGANAFYDIENVQP